MSVVEELTRLFEEIFQRSDLSFNKPTDYDLFFIHKVIKTEVNPLLPTFGLKDIKWFYDRRGKVHFIDLKPEKEVWRYLTTYYVDENYTTYFQNLRKKGYKIFVYPRSYFIELGKEIAKIKKELQEKNLELDLYSILGTKREDYEKGEIKEIPGGPNTVLLMGIKRKEPLLLERKIKETIKIAEKNNEFSKEYLKALTSTLLCVSDGILVSVDFYRKEENLKKIVEDLTRLCGIKKI
ncbi:MAG: hypothetical protein QXX07_02625 [Candidatus Aenigmatarchaeota archaeon]